MSRDPPADKTFLASRLYCNLLLSFTTIAVLTLTAEVAARVFYHPPNLKTVIRFDRGLGWTLEPNARQRSVDHRRDLSYTISTNSFGMRERELTLDTKKGTGRILFIGDSVTFGTGVEAKRRFSDFIARAVKENTETINAGVPGWGNDQELIYFESVVGSIKPDLVVLTLTMANDVVNNALDHLFLGTAPKPRFVLKNDSLELVDNIGETRKRPAGRHELRRILRRSRFLLFVKRRLDRLRHRPDSEPFPEVPPGFGYGKTRSGYTHWSVFEKAYVPQIESAWRVTEVILERFAAACKKNNADLIILAFPLKMEVDEAWRGRILDCVKIDPGRFDFQKPYRRLSTFCATHSLELCYPLEEFKEAFRFRDLYFEKDGHPNEYGHAMAARVLLQRFEKKHGYNIEIAESDRAYMTGL